MKVITSFIYPPIPVRQFDWMAYIDGDEGDGPTGRGETEADALRDLAETLAERSAEGAGDSEASGCSTVTKADGSDEQNPGIGTPAKGER